MKGSYSVQKDFFVQEIQEDCVFLNTRQNDGCMRYLPCRVDPDIFFTHVGERSIVRVNLLTIQDPHGSEIPQWWLDTKVEPQVIFGMKEWEETCKKKMEELLFNRKVEGNDKLKAYLKWYPYSDQQGPAWQAFYSEYKKGRIFIENGVVPGCQVKKTEKNNFFDKITCPLCHGHGRINHRYDAIVCPYCGCRQDTSLANWKQEPVDYTCTGCGRLMRLEQVRMTTIQAYEYTPWDVKLE